jgi:hypothetical protein
MTPIEISTDQDRLDVDMIHVYLANDSYWVPGISRSSVEKCIKHSLCFGAYADGRQIAFARIVTDYVRYSCARKPCRRRPATRNTEGVIR